MAAALRKVFPSLDLPAAQEQVRVALNAAVRFVGGSRVFWTRMNEGLAAAGQPPVSQTLVYWWISEGSFVDKRYLPHIETMTDYLVTRRHLRPDIYGIGGYRIEPQ